MKTILAFVLSISLLFSAKSLSQEVIDDCQKKFRYDIYLSFFKMGYLHRTVIWKDQQATVKTQSSVNVFGIGTTYQQQTHFSWSETLQSFLTQDYQQTMTGFKSRTISTQFFDESTKSSVTLNRQTTKFNNQGKRLFDLDSLVSQIRFHVMNNTQSFTLYRQASDQIEGYQFEIIGEKKLKTKNWGEVDTIVVQQTGADESLLHWIAPSMDYQTIRVDNNGLLTGTAYLIDMKINCD